MLKTSEKQFDFVPQANEGPAGGYVRMPAFVTRFWLRRNVEKLRASMGGTSCNIARRPIRVEDRKIAGWKSDIGVRIYTPETDGVRPLMLFYHGGGWVGGSLKAVDDYCRAVADRADCVVVSADYHLAPEHPFPEGLEDAYAALKWAVTHAAELGADTNHVTVSGDSAGGNLSAVLSLLARDRDEFRVHRQILIYPATDLTTMLHSETGNKMEEVFGEMILEWYLNKKTDPKHPHVSPYWAENLRNLPAALIAVGDLDFLHKPSLAYAEKLAKAGNPVQFSLYRNTRHAFIDNTGNCPQAEALIEEVAAFMAAPAGR